jgi:archaellum component FlaC
MPDTVKITNKVEESKLEIKDVDSNSSSNCQTTTIPFNEEIPSNLKGRVEQLEKNS